MIGTARLRQWRADLLASFWLRPSVMALLAVAAAETLVQAETWLNLAPDAPWIYRGGESGARAVLGAIAASTIGVAGTVFSITVAALTLASNQMGPRLLRNFARDPGNQYALGALLSTFAFALIALRSVRGTEEGVFVPHLAVTTGLLLALGCVGVLIWFIHHLARSINVDRVIALVQRDLAEAVAALPGRGEEVADAAPQEGGWTGAAALLPPASGYLRVLDEAALADWAAECGATLRLTVRPGHFVFAGVPVGEVVPAVAREAAERVLHKAMTLGDSRSIEQDLEHGVRQLAEIALRALSPGVNDPFTAIAVLDRLGATLCALAGRRLPEGVTTRGGIPRLLRPTTDYPGLLDTMFHMVRQAAATQPAVLIRLQEILAEVARAEADPQRRRELRRHATLARETALAGTTDNSAREAVEARHARLLVLLGEG